MNCSVKLLMKPSYITINQFLVIHRMLYMCRMRKYKIVVKMKVMSNNQHKMIYQKIYRYHKLRLLKVTKKWMRSINAKQRQVLNFIYLWAKEIVKQQGLVKSMIGKSLYFFLSESGGVEKRRLIKTNFQSVSKALQVSWQLNR